MNNYLINKFLNDVKKLTLKFPASEIAEKTGYSRSNVSYFLNGKRQPSRKFIEKFYEVFYKGEEFNVLDNLSVMEPKELYQSNYSKLVDSKDELIEAQKELIKALKERIADLEERVSAIEERKNEKAGSRQNSA